LAPILIEAVKDQQKQINDLKKENLLFKEMASEVENLKSELAQIKALLQKQE
jgi:hypothetical protein